MRPLPLRPALALVPPTTRAVRWWPLAVTAVAAVAVAARLSEWPYVRVGELRIGAILLALGAAFLLDDPSAETTGHMPVPLLARRVVRLAVALPLIACAWGTALLVAGRQRPTAPLDWPALTLELAGLLALGLAFTAIAARHVPEELGGTAAAPAVLAAAGLLLALPHLPGHVLMFATQPSDPAWPATNGRWVWLLVLALLVALWESRDPLRGASVRRYASRTQRRRPGEETASVVSSPGLQQTDRDGSPPESPLVNRRSSSA